MHDVLLMTRLGLAAVFAVAGVGKFLDIQGSRRALSDFEVPDRFVDALAFILPAAELGTAVSMLVVPAARWAGLAALLLLGAFVVGLTRALRHGEAPDCHCFGQVHSEPASWRTVARNIALAIPATYLAAAGPGPSIGAWLDEHSAQGLGLIATGSLALMSTVSAVVLWRENRKLRSTQPWKAPTPVRVGARAPRFSLPSVEGSEVSLQDLLAGELPCVLTFVAPGCGPCATLLPEIARWRETLAERLALAVISAGDVAAAAEFAEEHGLAQILSDSDSAVSRAYGVPGTPCSVLVARDGTVASAPAPGQFAIEALIRVALHEDPRPALVVHQVA
jgi:peroxiredoxin/uncharacterized membrane protein YphA (DoxX/SURF4 family)